MTGTPPDGVPAIPDSVSDRVRLFRERFAEYHSPAFNEASLRSNFLRALFHDGLGWDVENDKGLSEATREVLVEETVDVKGAIQRLDYVFRLGEATKFIVEAKKPAIDILKDPEPALQLRNYGWNQRLSLCVLTNFEIFAVYDVRIPPRPGDEANVARIGYFRFEEYGARWQEIWRIFSRIGILGGGLDREAAKQPPTGREEVDESFLNAIELWREKLATHLKLRNPSLTKPELNFAVQAILDRIIFLRICEDRGVEPPGRLKSCLAGTGVYSHLNDLFQKADQRYNSGLFHFEKEAGRGSSPDGLTPGLTVEDDVLRSIISKLYHPSPYNFKILPVEILGQVYERFLGKVIVVTEKRARVEEKPEVKKAGGVYYTPTFVVEYIVRATLGRLVDGKTPDEVAKLMVLDPACGSGSFLLGAYQFLLDWHLMCYAKSPKKWKDRIVETGPSRYALAAAERKRILLNNLFGVDIDNQAVEVTKLSLLLKLLEKTPGEAIERQLRLSHIRALPDLENNIKCGNSLLDFRQVGQALIDDETLSRLNPFDWRREFHAALDRGGFDAVIGNPPYGYWIPALEQALFQASYKHQDYQKDLYLLFMERCLTVLTRENGMFGMIIPNPWLTNIRQRRIRSLVFSTTQIQDIIHFGFPVFKTAIVDCEVLVARRGYFPGSHPRVGVAATLPAFEAGLLARSTVQDQDTWLAAGGAPVNVFLTTAERALREKVSSQGTPTGKLYTTNVGIKPYQVGKGTPPQTRATVTERPFDSDHRRDPTYRPCLRGSDIERFAIRPGQKSFLKYGPWLAEPRPTADFDAPIKILMRQTGDSLVATVDVERHLCLNNIHVLVPTNSSPDPWYTVALLNSKLLNWWYHGMNPEEGEALAEVKGAHVAALPLRVIDPEDVEDSRRSARLSEHARSMQRMLAELASLRTDRERTLTERKLAATAEEIDRLVFELYGISREEHTLILGPRSVGPRTG